MAIQDQFAQILGRIPTPEESAYFQKFMADGQLQEYEIGEILKSTPEFQSAQLGKDTAAYGEKLQANDNQILQQGAELAGAQAQSRFAGLGRPNSSAMAAQVFGQTGNIAQGLAQRRQSALADFYGQGLRQNAALMGQQGQASRDYGYGVKTDERRRGYELSDYYRQKNDYEDAKNASSGWKAITPEFAVGQGVGLFGKWLAGAQGAMGKAAGGGV